MSLINCPECHRKVSDKAETCPQCGYPIAVNNARELECPAFPDDLSLGNQICAWGCDAAVKGKLLKTEKVTTKIPDGTIHAILYERGIQIRGSFHAPIMNIHKSQLIDIAETSEVELVSKNKSVVGRAAVGALLFGPFGGIVGGLSGLNTTKSRTNNMLFIFFWDDKTREPASIVIGTDNPLNVFLKNSKDKLFDDRH